MLVGGKELKGELLDREQASRIYQEIVSRKRDPALLEYMGTRMYKARVYPIAPHGEVRIQLDYSQTIEVAGGLATYRYPLNTEKFSSAPLNDVSVRVRIRSQLPIAAAFCPSHKASVDRVSPREYSVGYEEKHVRPDRDFIVGWQAGGEEFGLALLTWRQPGEDGYFMARIVPSMLKEGATIGKDVTFVIDTSGSMAGRKIEQAREALRYCVRNLNERDRFGIISFSTEVRPWRDELSPATRENVESAAGYVRDLAAAGGTNINDALLDALGQGRPSGGEASRPHMIVFLTDGLPTIGERDVDRILVNARKQAPASVRLFVFGVGNDVNTRLLDKLAEEHHGARQYVSEQEDLEVRLSGFYAMIANPVLSDLKLAVGGQSAYDVYPRVLPDLFKGSELVVFGRYRATGSQTVVLTGRRNDESVMLKWERPFPAESAAQDYLPRLWANRKIGYLLDEMRMNGENGELKNEVVRLAKRFGILTPYTSYLVLEESELRAADGLSMSGAAGAVGGAAAAPAAKRQREAFGLQTGGDAIRVSKDVRLMQQEEHAAGLEAQVTAGLGGVAGRPAGAAAGTPSAVPGSTVRFVAAKTFYWQQDRWVDSDWDPAGRPGTAAAPKPVRLFSDEYYHLVSRHPEAGRYFALGTHVIVVLDGQAYETVE
jgi:Ca-activated chloride channel family protein